VLKGFPVAGDDYAGHIFNSAIFIVFTKILPWLLTGESHVYIIVGVVFPSTAIEIEKGA
jgi:hypothetical protein